MSVETMLQKHQFIKTEKISQYDHSCGIYANYLHDLESIWWTAVWTLFTYRKESTNNARSESDQEITKKKTANSKLFSHGNKLRDNRKDFLIDNNIFDVHMSCIPKYFGGIKDLISSFRTILHDAYLSEEKNLKTTDIIMPSEESLHQLILRIFRESMIDESAIIPDDYAVSGLPSLKHSVSDEDMNEKPEKKLRYVSILIY